MLNIFKLPVIDTLKTTEFHFKVLQTEIRVVDLLSAETGLSKQSIKSAMQKGAAWISDDKGTRRVRRQDKLAKQGNELHLYYNEVVLSSSTEDAVLLSDEGEYSAWYKPRGMMSQGSKWGDHCAINRWVEVHDVKHRPVFIVHRLDRYTSGIILLAHTRQMARELSGLFQKRAIKKQYHAIVHGRFPSEEQTFSSEIDNKHAVTHARLISFNKKNNQSLVDIEIETGRKHQIRRHLSEAGYPVVGDRLYGRKDKLGELKDDLKLTAYKLSFVCPNNHDNKSIILDEELTLI